MNNRKTGLILSYSATVLNMLCGLFLSSYLLRCLGDFEYGLYQTISAFVSYLVVLEFGISSVMTRNLLLADEAVDPNAKKKVTSTLFYITVALSGLILLVGIIFYFCIPTIYADAIPAGYMTYSQTMFAVMVGYLLVSFCSNTLSGAFLGNENYNIGNTIKIVRTLLRTLVLIIGVYTVRSAMVIVLADVSISAAVLLFTAWYVKRRYSFAFGIRYFDWSVLKESFPLCVAMLLQAVINQANNNVDKMVISIQMSMESVTLYSVAMYIYSMFSTITTIPIGVYLPQVSRNMQKGIRGKELTHSLIPSGRLVALIGGGILFGFIAVGRQFISIIYGASYMKAWMIALAILIPMFVNMTGGNMVNVLEILNKLHIRSYLLVLTTLLNILMTVVFVARWGVIGAAMATGISLILGQLILMNVYYQKKLQMNVWWLYGQSYRGILPAEILAMLAGGAIAWLIPNLYLSFLIGGTVYVAVAVLALLTFGFTADEKKRVKEIISKLLRVPSNRDA